MKLAISFPHVNDTHTHTRIGHTMQTKHDATAIAEQCLGLVTLDDNHRQPLLWDENDRGCSGTVDRFSNHYHGRLKLHLHNGKTVSWRLPQHIINEVSRIIRVDGNNGWGE